jgi:serine/threonine protein kinase
MAELFLARQVGPQGFQKTVVVKRLHQRLASEEEVVKMFVDEARIAARLTHSNIVQIYDLGVSQGQYYIAMEWVRGNNLMEVIERELATGDHMPYGLVAHVVSQVCRGLHYAHTLTDELGRPLAIVHRDVSPQNVLLGYEGEVKLVDFGIAKAASRAAETQAGILKGKVAYMSPEQVQNQPVDARSDIFSAGILLYELTCRRRLFRRNSDFATMRAVLKDPIPPPSAVVEDVPDEIEMVILQALARDPERRFQSAQEMQHVLERGIRSNGWSVGASDVASFMEQLFRDGEPSPGPPAPARQPRPTGPPARLSPLPAVSDEPVSMELEDTVAALDPRKAAERSFVEAATVITPPRPASGPAGEEPDEVPTSPHAQPVPSVRPDSYAGEPAAPARRVTPSGFAVDPATQSEVPTLAEQDPTAVAAEMDGETQVRPPDFADIEEWQPDTAETELPPEEVVLPIPDTPPEALAPVLSPEPLPAEPAPAPSPPPAAAPAARPAAAADRARPTVQATPQPAQPVRRPRQLVLLAVAVFILVASLGALGVFLYKGGIIGPRRVGEVEIATKPAGATVYLDGKRRFAVTPTTVHGLKPGQEYMLVVVLEGFRPWKKKLTLDEDKLHRRFDLKLERDRPGGPPATLTVRVNEPDARVFLDGELKGTAPVKITDVPSGVSHTLVIKKEGFEDGVLQLDALEPRERRSVHVTLGPSQTKLIQGIERRKVRKGKGSSGPVEIPRSKVAPLREGNIGERLPGD